MRQDLPALIDLADRLLATGVPGTIATLFSARGSTYRPLGSMMVSLPGIHAGGISGGCLEDYVARAGERATREVPAAMLHFSTDPDADADVPALGCGGSIAVLVERLTSAHLRLLEQLAAAYERDRSSLLSCIVERSGRLLSVSRAWSDDVGRWARLPQTLTTLCTNVARDGKSSATTLDGRTDALVHYIPPLTRLVIFGAGDDARPLCTLGAQLGWHVSVVDRRARLATRARFPDAAAVHAADWEDAIDDLRFTSRTAAVLMTHSLDDDARVLGLLSSRPMAYLGALGPAHRRAWLLESAEAAVGLLQRDAASMLRGPIGLDLGDRSPAGIAVAVTAEILAHLNARSARSLHGEGSPSMVRRRPGVCVAAV